jgi:hypothetical protein
VASNAQETILTAFNRASGNFGGNSSVADSSGSLLATTSQGLTDALAQATQVISSQTQATSTNTEALAANSEAKAANSGASEVASVANTASQFLGGGLSLMPLVSLFSGLFGGGQSQQPAPLTPFSLPPSLNLASTTSNQDVSWGENGSPRTAGGSTANTTQQITVQVQAMDSQSFLDHSDDIAQAVKQAMLNMSSLNDVVTNL